MPEQLTRIIKKPISSCSAIAWGSFVVKTHQFRNEMRFCFNICKGRGLRFWCKVRSTLLGVKALGNYCSKLEWMGRRTSFICRKIRKIFKLPSIKSKLISNHSMMIKLKLKRLPLKAKISFVSFENLESLKKWISKSPI